MLTLHTTSKGSITSAPYRTSCQGHPLLSTSKYARPAPHEQKPKTMNELPHRFLRAAHRHLSVILSLLSDYLRFMAPQGRKAQTIGLQRAEDMP